MELSNVEALEELLDQEFPEVAGVLGKVEYSLTGIKVIDIQWPRVSVADGMYVAKDAEVYIRGNYSVQRAGMLGYNKSGVFAFGLGGLYLAIKENTSDSEFPDDAPAYEATCSVTHIKVKFQGGAAKFCQCLASAAIKMFHKEIEKEVSRMIQEELTADPGLLTAGFTILTDMEKKYPRPPEPAPDQTEEGPHKEQRLGRRAKIRRLLRRIRRSRSESH